MKLNKMREEMIQSFIDCLKKDTIPWHRGWSSERPFNAVTNTEYHGANALWLTYNQQAQLYKDPRWCTFKQAQSKGWKIKQGSKGTKIEFWSLYDTEDRRKLTRTEAKQLTDELTAEEFANRVKPVSNTYTVFNGEQIEGIPLYEIRKNVLHLDEFLSGRNKLIENMNVGFKEGGNEAFYSMAEDMIVLPQINQFDNEFEYITTFFHEAGHATGHVSRFNREMPSARGTDIYAREELRAEIASAFAAQTVGIDYTQNKYMENHEAYIQDYINVLENEPNELFAAIKDAEKISDYLIEKGEFSRQMDIANEENLIAKMDSYVAMHRTWIEENPVKKLPIVLNAYGGPGAGKSVACLDVCSALKKAGYTAEYVQEYAKELVYDKNMEMLNGTAKNQFEILKEQTRRVDRLYDQVDFIVTDSPIMLNTIYNRELTPEYVSMVHDLNESYLNFSFFIERDASNFEEEGRIHNLQESIEKDTEITDMLQKNEIEYKSYSHEMTEDIVNDAINMFKRYNPEVLRTSEKTADLTNIKFKRENDMYVQNSEQSLFSGADAARFRMALKGRYKSIDMIINDASMPGQLKTDVLAVGKIAMEAINNGTKIEDIVTSSVARIDKEAGIKNAAYTKNLLCNLFSSTRDEYEALKNLPDLWNRQNLVSISDRIADKLVSQQVAPVVTDSKGILRELNTPKQIRNNAENKFYVDKTQFAHALSQRPDIAPVVKCEWSEAKDFEDGKYYTLKEYDDMMRTTDNEFCATREQIKARYDTEEAFYNTTNSEEYRYTGYEKNKYTVDFGDGRTVTERQDIGDDEGGIMEHFKNISSLNVYVNEIKAAIEKDAEYDNFQEMVQEVYRYEQENGIPEDFRTTSEEMEVISHEMLIKQHELISRTQLKDSVTTMEKNMNMARTRFRGIEM